MEHIDEKILKIKKQLESEDEQKESINILEAELQQSIYDDVINIYTLPFQFRKRKILDEKATIYMPEDFEEAPEELIKRQYLAGNPPQYIYTSEDSLFSIGFNLTEHVVANEHIWDFLKAVELVIERSGPKVIMIDTHTWNKDELDYASLEFVSQAIDQAVYNHMFYSLIDGKLVIGFVNFPSKYNERLKNVAKEIVESFCVINGEVQT